MDGMLSQDEINALLSGMDLDAQPEAPAEEPAPAAPPVEQTILTAQEIDAVGEVANISMGSSATTLYSLVNQKVNISTPVVTIDDWDTLINDYARPCVFIQIRYTIGLEGSNILILQEKDVKIITDLMMGGDGSNTEGELGELHLSAISEAMNQMMGAAATSLSSMLGKKIDISPPVSNVVDLTAFEKPQDLEEFLAGKFCKIAFRMQIGDLVDSDILQIYPLDFAKSLYDIFIGQQTPEEPAASAPESQPQVEAQPQPASAAMQPDMSQMNMQQTGMGVPGAMPQMDMSQMGMPQMGMGMPQMNVPMGMPQMGMAPMGMPQMGMGMPQMSPQPMVNAQPAQFQSFTSPSVSAQTSENIGIIMDVPLEVTVELGRTRKSISEILDFSPGTIIELDKIAGEPVDILVNGKYIARGEVVVIEESFGVRVTEIIR